MGQISKWECKKCGYSVNMSGGHDRGFIAVTNTFQCTNCKKLMDISVGKYDEDGYHEDERNYYCKTCNNKLEVWDVRKKPCPHCGKPMIKQGCLILWD
ncbi:MAG: endonuclease Q family protein [Candidatus Symbiothrix sp.]|jgi:predicted RNA-binding Zn-ribbon protein involved in translation (DUF1610 family)|nr:endonuclease Q family protein [Candidatus Symbiothrix sp.]